MPSTWHDSSPAITHQLVRRTERAHRRCDIDDLVVIAEALGVRATALLPAGVCPAHPRHTEADLCCRAQGVLLG
ncbi:XRE family transcriptional regulator [Streptomyces griseoviridis]